MSEHNYKNDLESLAVDVDESEVKGIKIKIDKAKLFLPVSILIAGVLISGSLIYTSSSSKSLTGSGKNAGQVAAIGNEQPSGPVNVSIDDDAYLGDKNVPITMIEFSDFQCPFCRSFWRDTLPQIKKEYIDTGKLKFAYRDFPLSFHQGATPAAQATECAEDQGKFWQLHDKIFQEQDKQGQGTIQLTKSDIVKWAGQIGLDMSKFNQCRTYAFAPK